MRFFFVDKVFIVLSLSLVTIKMEFNNSDSSFTQYGIEKLVGTKYKYWRLCMEAYLQGQDLWDLVSGADSEPKETPENAEPR